MINLLQETIEFLEDNGKTPKDVKWVGLPDQYTCDWEDFSKLADFEYDNVNGFAEVNENLMIVGDDWWMIRFEFDGSESWDFHTVPYQGFEPNCLEKHHIFNNVEML